MIKKYEIITVGADKRIKALRSFRVQGRYVNIGDVGGIVYDENTLSQEGNCWIFSGNLNYPSIRVGGDSIVDTNGYEGAVTDPRPFVNITGTSALIGAHEFVTRKTSTAKVLAVGDVEQGNVSDTVGSTYDESKVTDANVIRLKSPIYMGGASATITLAGEGYEMQVLRYDHDKKLASTSEWGDAGSAGGAYYVGISIRKTPAAATVPADITEANVSIPSIAIESTINIKDTRIVFNYTSAMTVATKFSPGHRSANISPVSNISESNVAISKSGNGASVANIFADVAKCNVEWRLTLADSTLIGGYTNVERLVLDGSTFLASTTAVKARINVKDCGIFSMSTTVIPLNTFNDAIKANMPLTFIRCNVEHGLFYHNPVNRNVYTDIDFSKALTDLSEPLANADLILASGEKQGMYRVVSKSTRAMGPLVEDIHSVKNLNLTAVGANTQSVEIYKDATFTGLFDIAGTNVFGGTGNHGGGKGCEIINTKETPAVFKGNIRVEGNATVKDVSVTGTGYFGGDSVTEAPAALVAPMPIEGAAFMSGKAVFKPGTVNASAGMSILEMRDNAVFTGSINVANTNYNITMADNAQFLGIHGSRSGFVMRGNSFVAAGAIIASACRGLLIMKDDARIESGALTAVGHITLCGKYKQTAAKTRTGKRVINSQNAPEYDNNVKTQYDF